MLYSYLPDAVALLAAAVAFAAPLRWALGVLVGVVLLVPATMVLPHQPVSFLTVVRLVLVAFAVGLVRRYRRGELAPSAFAATQVHVAFLVFLTAATVLGVALAVPATPDVPASHALVALFDYFVFFAVSLAAVRSIGDDGYVLRLLGGLLVATAAVALVEHVTGHSVVRAVFYHDWVGGLTDPGGRELAVRGGGVRVRAAGQFAVEFAWVTAALVPVLLAGAARVRRAWVLPCLAGVGLALMAGYWSATRSAGPPLAVAVAVAAVAARHRRFALFAVGGVAVALAFVALEPSVLHHFSSSVDQGSIDSRYDRWNYLLGRVAHRPLLGLGLSDTETLGLSSTDNSYLLVYAELGVIGLAALGVLLLTGFACVLRGVLAADPRDRLLPAAAAAGVALLVIGGFAYDQVDTPQSSHLLWLLVAVGVASAERLGVAVPWPTSVTLNRVVPLPVAAGLAGVIAFLVAPQHTAASVRFDTLPVVHEARDRADTTWMGNLFVNTVCGSAQAAAGRSGSPLHLECRSLHEATGSGTMRLVADGPAQFARGVRAVLPVVRDAAKRGQLKVAVVDPPRKGRTTVLATAPVWAAVLALGLALFLPVPLPRRAVAAARSYYAWGG